MCVQCHGAPGRDPGIVGKGLRPPPPVLSEAVRPWDRAELFWIVKNGIKMTGMPASGPTIFGFWWHSSSDCRISTPNNTPNCSTDSTAWHKTINPAESEKSTGIDRVWPASSAHAHQGDGPNWTQDGFGVAFLGRRR